MKQLIPHLTRKNIGCKNGHVHESENYFAVTEDKLYRLFKCPSCPKDIFYGLDYDFKQESEVISYNEPRLIRLNTSQLNLIQKMEIYDKQSKRVKSLEHLIRNLALENETSNISQEGSASK